MCHIFIQMLQTLVNKIVFEFFPLASLEKVFEEGFPRWNHALQIEQPSLPDIAGILLLLQQEKSRQGQALNRSPGHYHAMLHLLAQAEDSTECQSAHIDEAAVIDWHLQIN